MLYIESLFNKVDLLAVLLFPVDAAHNDHDEGEDGGDEGVAVGGELLLLMLLSHLLTLHGHLVLTLIDDN